MAFDLSTTLLELGNATSENLKFSHRSDVFVSYGEETITEINLLEIRRRHPDIVHLRTYPKLVESEIGADWEWHIIGEKKTLRMRVQAKRLSRLNALRIKHKVKSSGEQQRELLVNKALEDGMKPVYCIYSSECQRAVWRRISTQHSSFEFGCLLADAEEVNLHVTRLRDIEAMCIPWHFLMRSSVVDPGTIDHHILERIKLTEERIKNTHREIKSNRWNCPTIDDLNKDTDEEYDHIGVVQTRPRDIARFESQIETGGRVAEDDEEDIQETGITNKIFVDVRTMRHDDLDDMKISS